MKLAAPVLALAGALASVNAAAASLDWAPEESPSGPWVEHARDFRDGLLGLVDCAQDLQLGLFAEAALLGSAAVMGVSELVGLVDDNPASEHLLRAEASKSLARTAYLLQVAGAESILGSHGLEAERYAEQALAELNPLLAGSEEPPSRLPLPPQAFFDDGMLHPDVYVAHVPGTLAAASLTADGLVRPVGFVLRALGARGASARLESFGVGLVRRALR